MMVPRRRCPKVTAARIVGAGFDKTGLALVCRVPNTSGAVAAPAAKTRVFGAGALFFSIMRPAADSYDLDEAAAPQQPWELVDATENPSPSAPSTPTAQHRRVDEVTASAAQQRRVDEVTASASSLGRELARDAGIRRRVGLPPVQSEAVQLRAEASRLRAEVDDLRASRFEDGALLDEDSRRPPPPPPAAEASLEPGEMLALAIGGAALVGIGAFLAVRHIGVAAALAAGTALVAVGEAERRRQEGEPTTPTTPRRRRASGGVSQWLQGHACVRDFPTAGFLIRGADGPFFLSATSVESCRSRGPGGPLG